MNKKPKYKYLSSTRIDIGRCPCRYDAFYNKKKYRDIESLPLKIGKFKHEFAQEYVNHCVREKQEGDPGAMHKLFNDIWKKHNVPEILYQAVYNECVEFSEKYINFDNVLDTEKYFSVEFDTGKFIDGKIDITRIYKFRGIPLKHNDKILHIFDYKNQAHLLKQDEILTPQMRIYTFAAFHMYPKFPYYRRGIYFMKYNKIRCYEDEDNPTPLMDIEIEIDNTKEWLLREWDKLIAAKEFPAIPGPWCYEYEGCPLLLDGTCPKINKKDFMPIKETVRKIFQMQTQIADLKRKAKEYITANGNVTVDGQEVGWIPEVKETYPFEQAYNLIKDSGYDLSEENFPKSIMERFIKQAKNKLDAKKILANVEKIKEIEDDTKFKF